MRPFFKTLFCLVLAGCVLPVLSSCGAKKTEVDDPVRENSHNPLSDGREGAPETVTVTNSVGDEVAVELGGSSIYTQKELDDAVLLIKSRFATFAGCELHSIRYAGDEADNKENLDWLNSLRDARSEGSAGGAEYTQVAEFLSDFHSPVEEGPYAWEIDMEYRDYQWWLARTKDGAWEIVSWGY